MNVGERDGERWALPGLGRRHFLIGAAAATAAVVTGCSSDSSPDTTRSTTTAAPSPTAPKARFEVSLDADPFTMGVASGDPLDDAVVIWTRLAPDLGADDGLGGMPADKADVTWEVATDRALRHVIATGVHTALPEHAHAVHVDVTGLEAGTTYWYRFRIGGFTSPVGRAKTLATGSPDQFGLAVVNCQMFENGTYVAYRHLADEEVDLVAHLGDYIYELPGGTGAGRHSLPNRSLRELADFRLRYASTKADPDLQAAHARFPFVVMWDDHEVANNYMDLDVPGDATADVIHQRRVAAYQAWWEHMPVRLDPPKDGSLKVYRDVTIGNLARLYLMDQRQYADEPPCRGETVGATDYGDCAAVEGEDRSRLGKAQEQWLQEAMASSTATWNLLGSPVAYSGIDAGSDSSAYYLDLWDGYPKARKRLNAQIAAVDNPVLLSGDYHAGMILDLHETPFDQSSPIIAPEFMAPAISSPLFDADVTGRTPQLRRQINKHGYLLISARPSGLTAAFRVLDDVKDPQSKISTDSTWTVAPGNPVTKRATA